MQREEIVADITDTLLDYCQYIDEARLDRISDLFCQDATFDDGNPAVGHEKVMRRIKRLLASVDATSHHLSNIRVEILPSPETSNAMSYAYAWHQRHDGTQFDLWIRYIDQLRLEEGRWRLHRRAVECAGFRGIDSFPVPRVKRLPID